jgi:hypothetical protein
LDAHDPVYRTGDCRLAPSDRDTLTGWPS